MESAVFRDKRGMTLIEIMIALLLMSIVGIAMVQSSMLVMNTNIVNELRDEAVSVAEQRMNEVRNTPFNSITSLPTSTTIMRNVRMVSNFTYSTSLGLIVVNTTTTQVNVNVSWTYRGRPYTHSVSTVLRRQ